ncbi:MAG: hypothetical protein JWM98_1185, partial [Thermoleophilia bacterium]|nr:hypothetical protein [Thermoleophilia bacterium]
MPPSDDPHDFGYQGDAGGSFPPPTTPRRVSGGIRAQGKLGASWWSRRWLAALEAVGIGDRLERGRAYARGGQVRTLEVRLGGVTASVQGTRLEPYEATVDVAVIEQARWLDVATALAGQARFRAQLLAGEVPEDIEAVFRRLDLTLFPVLEDDLRTSCTCADWASPCRHVAAACYLVGEALDRDPFLLFRMRGVERGVLLAMLAGITPEGTEPATDEVHDGDGSEAARPAPGHLDVNRFWHGDPLPAPPPLDLQPPAVDAPLVRLLGAPAAWTGADDFEPALRR